MKQTLFVRLETRNVNHIISKRLVAKAKDTGRAIALENLKGIRGQTTVRKESLGASSSPQGQANDFNRW